jgi:tetratricopeptide (TPR) repeat protein
MNRRQKRRQPARLLAVALVLLCGACAGPDSAGGVADLDEVVVWAGYDDSPPALRPDGTTQGIGSVFVFRNTVRWESWASRPTPEIAERLRARAAEPARRARREAAQEKLRASFDLLQRGDMAAAYLGFLDAVGDSGHDDNPLGQLYLGDAAAGTGRWVEAAERYRNVIALAPDSGEAIQARGRIAGLVRAADGGLRERVFEHATGYDICMREFVRLDLARRNASGIPSGRLRYQTMLRGLGANQGQMDRAMRSYDEFVATRQISSPSVRDFLREELARSGGFIPASGGFSNVSPSCPLGLLIEGREYSDPKAFGWWQARVRGVAAPGPEPRPDWVWYGRASLPDRNRKVFPVR